MERYPCPHPKLCGVQEFHYDSKSKAACDAVGLLEAGAGLRSIPRMKSAADTTPPPPLDPPAGQSPVPASDDAFGRQGIKHGLKSVFGTDEIEIIQLGLTMDLPEGERSSHMVAVLADRHGRPCLKMEMHWGRPPRTISFRSLDDREVIRSEDAGKMLDGNSWISKLSRAANKYERENSAARARDAVTLAWFNDRYDPDPVAA